VGHQLQESFGFDLFFDLATLVFYVCILFYLLFCNLLILFFFLIICTACYSISLVARLRTRNKYFNRNKVSIVVALAPVIILLTFY